MMCSQVMQEMLPKLFRLTLSQLSQFVFIHPAHKHINTILCNHNTDRNSNTEEIELLKGTRKDQRCMSVHVHSVGHHLFGFIVRGFRGKLFSFITHWSGIFGREGSLRFSE